MGKKKRNKHEWADFWTGVVTRTHFNPRNEPNFVICRKNSDGGSMGFHHTSDIKLVTCKTCRKLAKKVDKL